MQTKPKDTVVIIPNDKRLHVSYYCSDVKLKEKEKNKFTNLVIQLDDCHSSIKIPKEKVKEPGTVEALVHRTVINARGHLCD